MRDGANLAVAGYDFAPSFSIWTTIEECLNPPVVYEKDRGWFTTEPFSEPEVFDFPEGIGPVECVNVEHEEVLLMPRWVDAKRVTFKYGLGDEFIDVLKTLHKLGLDRTEQGRRRRRCRCRPRDVVAACLPDPATLGRPDDAARPAPGCGCAGTGKDGAPRSTYLYHVVDNEWSMREYGSQAVVWQTAVNPVVALELIADRACGRVPGVLGPEAFDAVPFLDLLAGRVRLALGPAGTAGLIEPTVVSAAGTDGNVGVGYRTAGRRRRAPPTTDEVDRDDPRAADTAAGVEARLLHELEPVVAENLERHLAMAKPWHPHDYVPWSRGRDFAFLGGRTGRPRTRRSTRWRRPRWSSTCSPRTTCPRTTARSRPGSAATARGASGSGAGRPRRVGTASRCATTSS